MALYRDTSNCAGVVGQHNKFYWDIGTTQQLSTGVSVAIMAVLLYRDSAEAPLQLLDFQYTFLTLALILLSVWPVLWSLTPQDGMAMRGEREL